jgi:methylated-DNA-[protein]-cysteine S-methyltransferase
MIVYSEAASPLGRLLLVGDGLALTGVFFDGHRHFRGVGPAWRRDDEAKPFDGARTQLAEFFDGRRTRFDLPLAAVGTDFQRGVWRTLARLPFGATTTYASLAATAGRPEAARAVGAAVGRNPLSIVVPCHRVVGADGALIGYAGGLDRKRFLLDFESRLGAPVRPRAARQTGTG